MSKFIRVKDSRHGDSLFINIEAIAWVNENAGVVCFSTVHGEGTGMLSFSSEDMAKIIAALWNVL